MKVKSVKKVSCSAWQRRNTTWTSAWANQRVFIICVYMYMLIFYISGFVFQKTSVPWNSVKDLVKIMMLIAI